MEQKRESCISDEYPLLVAHNLDSDKDDTGDQIFYTIHDPMSYYRCRIPELVGGRCIRATFHGWMILSKLNQQDIEWSLWNPVISKLIQLPRLFLKKDEYDDFDYCCLSSPPDDPAASSILLLMRSTKPNIVFFNIKRRKRSRLWTEISYSKQIKNIINSGKYDDHPDYDDHDDHDDHDQDNVPVLLDPTCCNGNIYASSYVSYPPLLIQIHINMVREKQVVINLVPLVKLPWSDWQNRIEDYFFLKGSCKQLFTITLSVDDENKPCDVYLFKLDMGSMVWTEIKDDDADESIFFVSLADDDLVYSSPPIRSKLGGGYIHILDHTSQVIYSYNIKDKAISMSSMHCLSLPSCSISIWTMPTELIRLHGKANCKLDGDHDQMLQLVRSATTTAINIDDDACVVNNIPFDVLETIMKFCVGIEYLNFRATCTRCRLAAPMIQWSNEKKRLQTYSLVSSPWLIVIDKNHGVLTFTDPMFGDTYFMKAAPSELVLSYHRILCSRYGWLLLHIMDDYIAFFNPFTSEIRKLSVQTLSGLESYSFSAPPTSPDCMVVAFLKDRDVSFHRVGGEPSWHRILIDFGNNLNTHDSFWFPVFCGEDVYALNGGGLAVFRNIDNDDNFSWKRVVDAPRTSNNGAKYFQTKCDQHDSLLVMVEEFGKSVKVFKLKENEREWVEIDGLGRHAIYICDTACMCMDAKIPEMENKFPRVHDGKIVFYCLERRMYHTFNGRNVEENLADLFGTKQTVYPHAWIEPTWS